MVQGWELRSERRRAGLTLKDVARAAGTSETNVAAYERGAKQPNEETAARLAAMVRVGADSPIHRNRLLTVPAAAAELRRGLRHGWATVDLLRVVRELVANAKWLQSAGDVDAFLSAPSTTGDPRWDAMLAGTAELLALHAGHAVPRWTAGKELGHLWFVSSLPPTDAYALAHTPSPLRIRGVVVDEASLASV